MTQTSTRPAPATSRWRWVGLVALLTAEAMNLLDATAVQVARMPGWWMSVPATAPRGCGG